SARRRVRGAGMRVLTGILLATLLGGCSRAYYRRDADRETYPVIAERAHDPRWALPHRSIVPPPASRLFDPFDPDNPPQPADDPAAHVYMKHVNGMKGVEYTHTVSCVSGRAALRYREPRWRSWGKGWDGSAPAEASLAGAAGSCGPLAGA